MSEQQEMHYFWSKQPVQRPNSDVRVGYIDESIPVSEPPAVAPLPKDYTWVTYDIFDDKELGEVYEFLANHYVEDNNGAFRFHVSRALLRFALGVPGHIKDWMIGVKSPNGKLVGFISGIPQKIRHLEETQIWCAVNFLCVHNKLRSKNLASALIAELARRVRVHKVYRAIFSGDSLPENQPFCQPHYVHRPINVNRLSTTQFYPVPRDRLNTVTKRFAVPQLAHGNVRPMNESDIPKVVEILNDADKSYDFALQFDEETVKYMFMPREDVVYSYVIPRGDSIVGFFSFYMMDWTVLKDNSMNIDILRSAYIWYTHSLSDLSSIYADIINRAAKDAKADVINGLIVGSNEKAMISNKFEKGTKSLKFYSYNYGVPKISSERFMYFFI